MTFPHIPSTGRLRFVAALLLGTTLATAVQAETLTVTEIQLPGADLYKLSIPSVEVTDGNLTEAEIRGLERGELAVWDVAAGEEVSLSSTLHRVILRAAPPGATARPVPGQRLTSGTRHFVILSVTEADPAGRYLLCITKEEFPT